MGSLIYSLCYMVITELEPSHSEDSVSQEKEIITKMYKVFFKIYVLIMFLIVWEMVLGKDTRGKEFYLPHIFCKSFLIFST